MTSILSCFALLGFDATLACVLHTPGLDPVVLGETGTPQVVVRREYGDPHFDDIVCSHVTGSCLVTYPGGRTQLIPFPDEHGNYIWPLVPPPGA